MTPEERVERIIDEWIREKDKPLAIKFGAAEIASAVADAVADKESAIQSAVEEDRAETILRMDKWRDSTAYERGREAGLEEAALIADQHRCKGDCDGIAGSIRAMKEKRG